MREFWRRWHISLSTWFQDYLYIPLGGSRASSLRTYFNLVLVFFLCGLWHGASWTFVVWGLYHGGFLVLERQARFARLLHRLGRLSHIYTMLVVICGWVLFRAETFSQAVAFFRAMSGRGGADPTYPLRWFLTNDVALALLFGRCWRPRAAGGQRCTGCLAEKDAGGGQPLWRWTGAALRRRAGAKPAAARRQRPSAAPRLQHESGDGHLQPFIYFRF